MKEVATIFDFARMCSSNGCDFGRECPAKGFCPIGYKFTKDMAAELNDIILRWNEDHPIQTHADNFVSKTSNWINAKENNDKHKDKHVLVSENDSYSCSCEHCLHRKVCEYYENMSAMGKCHLFDMEV